MCAIVQEEEMSGSSVAEAYNVVWGPVEEEIAKKYGALAGGQSILVRPVIDGGKDHEITVSSYQPRAVSRLIADVSWAAVWLAGRSWPDATARTSLACGRHVREPHVLYHE